jgi:DNA-binding NtrC family response regulator
MTKLSLPIGNSDATGELCRQISIAARFDEPVLVVGETGVGKELVARAIHAHGERSDRPLQVVHCAGIPAEMLAAELFGHRAGSFTGANQDRRGRIRAAAGSTVVLDEVSETPCSFQAALLRVIEQREVQPVGVDAPVSVDARFVATSNRPVEELAAGEGFRRDLFYRLASFVIHVPPLRQRPADIAPIAAHFMERLCSRYGETRELSARALESLHGHPYPGNVRELKQVLVRAYAATEGRRIGSREILRALGAVEPARPDGSAATSGGSLESVIRAHITATIRGADGNLSEAARRLEVPRSTLQHYLVKYRVGTQADDDGRRAATR